MKNLFTYILPPREASRKRRSTLSFLLIFGAILISLAFLLAPASAAAREADHYAPSSVLASGKWMKVKVASTGMQFISNATLSKMGFRNPKDVRVYGYGGRILPEALTATDPDDLPLTPSLTTDKGIYFFGYDHIRWTYDRLARSMPLSHTMHPYAEESWYFLTDSTPDAPSIPLGEAATAPSGAAVITSFIQPVVHESDLAHPSNTGGRYLGEDFRSPNRRTFDLSMPDAVADADCYARVTFGANTSAASTLSVKATGKSGTTSEYTASFKEILNTETFMNYVVNTYASTSTTPRNLGQMGESVRFDVEFKGGGTIKLARLDYIELNYERRLRMAAGELHFHIDTTDGMAAPVAVEGAEASTVVWDVTLPAAPVRVPTSMEGSRLTFVHAGGLREYVAFTPDKGGAAITEGTAVANQDLHSLPVPDMLIIAPASLHDAARKLAAHHAAYDGLQVEVIAPETIYNEFSCGTPDPSAFRGLLKMWYDRGNAATASPADPDAGGEASRQIKYCLIMGRATYDHKRRTETIKNASWPIVPIWQSLTGETQAISYCCEDYIGMLRDVKTFDIGKATLDVSVGRFPVMSAAEAGVMVDKYINYVTAPEPGFWRNQVMLIADDQNKAAHLNQSENMMRGFTATRAGKNFRYERLYLDAFQLENSSLGHVYPQAKEKMLRLWNDGVMYINYIGHANPTSWTHENLLTWTDINSFSNKNLPFIYAATCEFGRIDADTRSGAEVLWAYPSEGIIGILTPSRTVYIDSNGQLSNQMGNFLFQPDADGKSKRIGDVMIQAKNARTLEVSGGEVNKLRYGLIGNPAMRLPVPQLQVNVDKVGDAQVDPDATVAPNDYPVFGAQGRMEMSGHVSNHDGTPAEDFNGVVDIVLYDAESTVQTNGNGDDGAVSYYNDRRTLLYRGKAKVADGKWQTTVLLPSEIENNYSPAQFLFYAYSADAREAHGQYSDFYVYGYDESGAQDAKGPEIEYFALNRPDFVSGGYVHSSPVVLARISDESGVNISAAGIGHQMTLVLDGKTIYNDVNAYYTPDAEDFTAGEIVYPLANLAPGRHTLRLNVWDNSLNSSVAELEFEVAANKTPEIFSLSTDVNPARDNVNFTLSTDMPMAKMDCMIEVFDLNGRRVWSSQQTTATDISAGIRVPWNLCDASGVRVPRGIYVYRATVTTPSGPSATKSYKLAVTAP